MGGMVSYCTFSMWNMNTAGLGNSNVELWQQISRELSTPMSAAKVTKFANSGEVLA